jgi:hypothetical protein
MTERDFLVDRLERYFQHSDADHKYLTVGDRAAACHNLRDVFSWLKVPGAHSNPVDDAEFFDPDLEKQVKAFQKKWQHPIVDGKVGPNTRSRLVRALLDKFDVSVFGRLKKNEDDKPTVFISYAWADSERVDKLDQWLRNHGLRVLRDRETFVAGATLNDNIRAAIGRADKVIVCHSKHSSRDWPQFERAIADQVEKRMKTSVLIYVRLDDTPLPSHDPTRLAIDAVGVPLRTVGLHLLRAVTGAQIPPPTIEIDENEPI